AIIGGGNMGLAIASGGLASRAMERGAVVVAEPDVSKHASLGELGVAVVESAGAAMDWLERTERAGPTQQGQVLLAIKPQLLNAVARELAARIGDRVVISIMAGVPSA